jgi:hypothetical protein
MEGLCVEESSMVNEPRLCADVAAELLASAGCPLMPLPELDRGTATNEPEPLGLPVVNADDGGLDDTPPGTDGIAPFEPVGTGEKLPGLPPLLPDDGGEASMAALLDEGEGWFCMMTPASRNAKGCLSHCAQSTTRKREKHW